MKKILAIFLVLVMLLSVALVSCNNKSGTSGTTGDDDDGGLVAGNKNNKDDEDEDLVPGFKDEEFVSASDDEFESEGYSIENVPEDEFDADYNDDYSEEDM